MMNMEDLEAAFKRVAAYHGTRAGLREVVMALRDHHLGWYYGTDITNSLRDILATSGMQAAGVLAVESREVVMTSEAAEAPAADRTVGEILETDEVKP